MARTALYRRISEDRDERELGITRQAEDAIELCMRKGWPTPVLAEYPAGDVFTDTNVTARLYEREHGQPHPGGNRAFGEPGTGPKGNGKRRVPAAQVVAERALILQAATRVDQGDSMRAICIAWNDEGITTAKGGKWTTPP